MLVVHSVVESKKIGLSALSVTRVCIPLKHTHTHTHNTLARTIACCCLLAVLHEMRTRSASANEMSFALLSFRCGKKKSTHVCMCAAKAAVTASRANKQMQRCVANLNCACANAAHAQPKWQATQSSPKRAKRKKIVKANAQSSLARCFCSGISRIIRSSLHTHKGAKDIEKTNKQTQQQQQYVQVAKIV